MKVSFLRAFYSNIAMISLILTFAVFSLVEPMALNITGKSVSSNEIFVLIPMNPIYLRSTMLWNMLRIWLSSWPMLFTIRIVNNFLIQVLP